jgi:hypothetical protein
MPAPVPIGTVPYPLPARFGRRRNRPLLGWITAAFDRLEMVQRSPRQA